LKVLPKIFNDRFQQMMRSKLVALRKKSSVEFSKAGADAARRGKVSSSSTAGLRSQVNIHLVKKIITAAVVVQRELISELQIPFSDTLAGELKDQVKAYVSNERCEDLHKMNIGGISEQHAARLKEELYVNRGFFLKRADAQIDFFVDSLRRKQSGHSRQSQVPPKEVA
jgi:hypothetical protein